jgi:putative (di)nucleoside polyphosphate hydrolase
MKEFAPVVLSAQQRAQQRHHVAPHKRGKKRRRG